MAVAQNASGELQFDAGYGINPPDAEMTAKWNAVINGGSGTAHGIPYTFSGTNPNFYYITKLAGQGTLDAYSFIGVDKCYHTGEFLDYHNPEPVTATLGILDTCPACVDCPEFSDVHKYLNIILDAYDLQKETLINSLSSGILNRYMTMIEMWNYIVNYKSWRYNAEAKGGEVYASCKYTNHTDNAIPAGMRMTIDFSDAPSNSRAFFIDTAVKAFNRSDCLIKKYTLTSVTLETTKPLPIGSGIRFYCGSLSPYYYGTTKRVNVKFSISFIAGGIGNKTTGFNTNIMVAIDPSAQVPPWTDDSSSESSSSS